MIGALRTWLLSIIAAGLVLSILYALLPKGRLRPIVRTAGGVVLMLVILRPLTELDLEGFAVSYDDYAREIRELTEQYRAADTAELAAIIERETAAYISDKGAALGVNCHAVVETELRSGVPSLAVNFTSICGLASAVPPALPPIWVSARRHRSGRRLGRGDI